MKISIRITSMTGSRGVMHGATASVMIIQLFYTIILARSLRTAQITAHENASLSMPTRQKIFHIIRLKFHQCRVFMHA